MLIRFQPNTPGKLHRHVCGFSTLVLQGELPFWRPDGSLKEVRPAESYVQVAANGEPHSEGAADQIDRFLGLLRDERDELAQRISIAALGVTGEIAFGNDMLQQEGHSLICTSR